jgi:hypothetical protein
MSSALAAAHLQAAGRRGGVSVQVVHSALVDAGRLGVERVEYVTACKCPATDLSKQTPDTASPATPALRLLLGLYLVLSRA